MRRVHAAQAGHVDIQKEQIDARCIGVHKRLSVFKRAQFACHAARGADLPQKRGQMFPLRRFVLRQPDLHARRLPVRLNSDYRIILQRENPL